MLKKQVHFAEVKLEELKERLIDNQLPLEVYNKGKEKYTLKREELLSEIKKSSIELSNHDEMAENMIKYSINLASLWAFGDYATKVKIQNFTYPSGILYNKENNRCRTPEINAILSYIALLARLMEEKTSV